MKCKKCGCEIDNLKEITALEIDIIDFWGCPECKKEYPKRFNEQKLKPLVLIKPDK